MKKLIVFLGSALISLRPSVRYFYCRVKKKLIEGPGNTEYYRMPRLPLQVRRNHSQRRCSFLRRIQYLIFFCIGAQLLLFALYQRDQNGESSNVPLVTETPHLSINFTYGSNDTNKINHQNKSTSDTQNKDQDHAFNTTLPKIIWMFWDKGFDHPSALREALPSLQSFELINPTWTLNPLNNSQADALTDRPNLIPSSVWKKIGMAGKADIYRLLLLQKYGGVWADASLFCSTPLDSWLSTNQSDLFTFLRYDNPKEQAAKNLHPWMTSWFLASPPGGYTLTKMKEVITDPKNFHFFTSEYFWFHRIFAKLVAYNEKIRRRAFLFPAGGLAYCFPKSGDYWRTSPVFKRCKTDLFKQYLIPTAKKCCMKVKWNSNVRGDSSTHFNVTVEDIRQAKKNNNFDSICKMWDCSTLGPNMVHP